MGNYYTHINDKESFNEAIVYYDKVLAIEPNHTRALSKKGQDLLNLGKSNEAVSLCDRVLAIEPNNTAALNGKRKALDLLSTEK